MTTTIILAAALFVNAATTNQAASYPAAAPRLADGVMVVNLAAADRATRESCGWYALVDEPPTAPAGYYAAPIGYAPNADGYYRVYTIAPLPPDPPRRIYKYDLSTACIEYGEITNLIGFISADIGVKWMWDAAEMLQDDDPYFIAATNEVVQSGLIPEAKVKAILDRAWDLRLTSAAAED